MARRYGHLSHEERGMIFAERRRGASLRAIGGLLGRAASTISRELGRGEGEDGRARHWGGKPQPKPWPKKSRPSDQTLHLQAESKHVIADPSQNGFDCAT